MTILGLQLSRKHAGLVTKNKNMKTFVLLVLLPVLAQAEEIKPFNQLGKENVTLRVKQIKSGNSFDYNYKASWGSYDRDVTTWKDVEISVEQSRAVKVPVTLEFYFLFNHSKVAKFAGKADVPLGVGDFTFSGQATRNDANWIYLDLKTASGDKMSGWFVRAIKDGAVVGATGSNQSGVKLAENPLGLQKALTEE